MTPKPENLPAPADMDLSTLLREVARVLGNAGGAAYGAGYSDRLAQAALLRADNLPGWRDLNTMPAAQEVLMRSTEQGCAVWPSWSNWDNVTHWYDFGHGAPMPPAPEGEE